MATTMRTTNMFMLCGNFEKKIPAASFVFDSSFAASTHVTIMVIVIIIPNMTRQAIDPYHVSYPSRFLSFVYNVVSILIYSVMCVAFLSRVLFSPTRHTSALQFPLITRESILRNGSFLLDL